MSHRSEAEEHLRVIRSLMEKATIYRALSAEAALLGGGFSLAAAILIFSAHGGTGVSSLAFAAIWLGIFLGTLLVSLFLLRRDAARRGETFVSSGFRSAIRAMVPPLVCGAVISVCLVYRASPDGLPAVWMIFYGLALLATAHFAPRSIGRLGWAFTVAGLLVAGLGDRWLGPTDWPATRTAALLMAATFGLFHLLYAACTWPRKSPASGSGDPA